MLLAKYDQTPASLGAATRPLGGKRAPASAALRAAATTAITPTGGRPLNAPPHLHLSLLVRPCSRGACAPPGGATPPRRWVHPKRGGRKRGGDDGGAHARRRSIDRYALGGRRVGREGRGLVRN